ncbi:phage antirepressor [Mammaliicoccus sciuri]|uniref:BRO family protein n=1 Tax=Mammaliicoccus sciuri TaxID=1296 RepID=UPI001C633B5C|nr:phage antirepressor [Mammaliicoccus sciuri]QYG30022.1 phage antirepressor [Mammaliicoccus sciuri]
MTNTKQFNNDLFSLQVLTIEEQPYFIGKEVSTILGYTNPQKAIRDHVDKEDKLTERIVLSGQNRNMIIINESGLYSLILKSKLPQAKQFKRWVTSEVLPSIRKHGAYLTDSKLDEVLSNPDTIIKLATQLKEEKQKVKSLAQDLNIAKPKIEYHDLILNNDSLLSVNQIAKDYGLSAHGFNQLLHDLGIQYKQSNTWHLYAKYQRFGYTQTQPYYDRKGNLLSTSTKWTQDGKKFLYKLLRSHDIYPVAIIPPVEYIDKNVVKISSLTPHFKYEEIQSRYGGMK